MLFCARTVKLRAPIVVGVPEILPFVFSVKPGGRVPETRLQVNGGVPVAESAPPP